MSQLVADFQKRTGIKVARALGATRRRSRTRSSQEGSRSPADVVLRREPAGADRCSTSKACSRRCRPRRWPRSRARDSSPDGRLGRRLGARGGARLQHAASSSRRRSRRRCSTSAEAGLEGPVGDRARRDRLPAADHGDRAAARPTPRRSPGCRRIKTQRQGLRRQRAASSPPSTRATVATPASRPLLLVPAARRGRRGADALGAALLRAARPGHARRRLGRGRPASRASTPPTRRRFLAYLVSKPAQTIIATLRELRVPAPAGRHRRTRSLRPLTSLVPARVTATQLGDGKAALALLQQVGLL